MLAVTHSKTSVEKSACREAIAENTQCDPISFRTVFLIKEPQRTVSQLSTIKKHPFTHRVWVVYLRQCTVITCLLKSVSFISREWWK